MDVEKQQQPAEAVPSGNEDGTTDDETLAGADKQVLQEKKEAIKLIEKNGAAPAETKIKIMEQEKGFSGMTKDELMKYANDPFWVRLRWFMFILFWVVWLAMLIGALMIIVYAPKCNGPAKLTWWQSGPLVTVDSASDSLALDAIQAKGVIYKVPADDTYSPERMTAHKKAIEDLVAANKGTKVIVDLVPNFVSETDDRFLKALVDKNQRAPFVWVDNGRQQVPNNWLALNGGSAWKQQNDSSYVLSQFAKDRYDLQMNNAENKERLKKVIRDYGKVASVCGFRLANTKHYIVNPALADEEVDSKKTGFGHEDYQFWTHAQTAYVTGLNDLLAEFKAAAINATGEQCNHEVFFGTSDAIEFVDVFSQGGKLTVEAVPVKLNLYQKESELKSNSNVTAEAISRELRSINQLRTSNVFAQYKYDEEATIEHLLFTLLLPGGIPVISQRQVAMDDDQTEASLKLSHLLALRNSASYTQGSFEIFQDATKQLVGYQRVQAGSPGYFVVYNPTAATVHGNFNATGVAGDLTVSVVSQNYKEEGVTLQHKLFANDVPVSAQSVVIMTFVQDASK